MGARRRLTLLRHGNARPAERDGDDRERRLTERGKQEAQEMARRLRSRQLVPDLIIASPAARAWATAEIIARTCALEGSRLRAADELYAAEWRTIWRLAAACDRDVHHLLICAHNPGLSELASRLGPLPQSRHLPTAGLASALWEDGAWDDIAPPDAHRCEFDDPQSISG
ncbi:MAG TPA: histidine phosphatase family protein [Steroidobacteraceae bacterium]|nr:histidine phosphatase family protein [Steroidobacteraceae bacterium]